MKQERGAAAVEFALVAMLLVTLLMGIMEFGWAFYRQGMLASAAREASRDFAIRGNKTLATAAAQNAAGSDVTFTITYTNASGVALSSCPAGTPVTVTLTHPYTTLTQFFGLTFNMTAKGTMRCGG